MSGLIAELAQWAVNVVYTFGYLGVFVLIALVNLHLLPIPTQLILALAGFLIGQGQFSFVLVLASSTTGAVVASLVLYFLGFCINEESLHQFVKRFERFRLIFVSDLVRASEVFERHGGKAILIGHRVPAVGAFISIPAGLTRMPLLGRFMIYTVLGSTLWNGIFIILGWVLGAQWAIVEQYASIIEYVALVAMVGGISWLLWRRLRTHG
jgi:membrane protein DedA with SNARE-associated domain